MWVKFVGAAAPAMELPNPLLRQRERLLNGLTEVWSGLTGDERYLETSFTPSFARLFKVVRQRRVRPLPV